MVTTNQPTDQPGEPRASLLVEHWAKQTFAKSANVFLHFCVLFMILRLISHLGPQVREPNIQKYSKCNLCVLVFSYFDIWEQTTHSKHAPEVSASLRCAKMFQRCKNHFQESSNVPNAEQQIESRAFKNICDDIASSVDTRLRGWLTCWHGFHSKLPKIPTLFPRSKHSYCDHEMRFRCLTLVLTYIGRLDFMLCCFF